VQPPVPAYPPPVMIAPQRDDFANPSQDSGQWRRRRIP
jgi:hypothetical protein